MQSSDTGTEKRGRGRPRKPVDPNEEVIIRRGRGRPIGSKNKPKDEKKGKKRSYTVSEKALAHRRQVTNALPARSEEEMAYNARLIEHTLRPMPTGMILRHSSPALLHICSSVRKTGSMLGI